MPSSRRKASKSVPRLPIVIRHASHFAARSPAPAKSVVAGQAKLPLAAPHSNYLELVTLPPVHDPKRGVDELPEKRLTEFRHDPTRFRVQCQLSDPINELCDEALTDIGNTLLCIPGLDLSEIAERGLSEPDAYRRHPPI